MAPKRVPKSTKPNKVVVDPPVDDSQLAAADFRLTADIRARMRVEKTAEIKRDCAEQVELIIVHEAEKRKQIEILENELNNEIRDTMDFLDKTMINYDEVLKQYTPPEEKPIDKIVDEIEEEFRKVYEMFAAGFEFRAELPEDYEPKEDEGAKRMQAEFLLIEEKIAKNKVYEEDLGRQINQIRADIEKEKLNFSAHRLQKDEQILSHQRRIDALEKKIDILQRPSLEKLQVADLLADVTRLREEIDRTSAAVRLVEAKIKESLK